MARIEVQLHRDQILTISTLTTGFLPVQSVAQRRTARRTRLAQLILVARALGDRLGRGGSRGLVAGRRRDPPRPGCPARSICDRRHAARSSPSSVTATEIRPESASRRRSFIVRAVGGQDDVAVEDEPPDPSPRRASPGHRGEPDQVAILLDDAVRDAARPGEARLLHHVAHLAMDGDDDLGPDPVVHGGELGAAGMAGDVDRRLAVGDHLDAALGQLVLDAADRDLVAGDLLGREDDEIARIER